MLVSQSLALLAMGVSFTRAAFKPGCSDAPWDSDTDFFLDKYPEMDVSLPFAPGYNKTFVTIRNGQGRWVVLHCTNEPPPVEVIGKESVVIKVPVKGVAALDGFTQNLIDMLGMSTTIKRAGKYADVTSSCIRGNMIQNITYDQSGWNQADPVDVTFHSDEKDTDPNKVLIYNNGMYAPLAQLNYLKFIAMFYGLESTANSLVSQIGASYRCAAATVQDAFMQGNLPTGALISPVEKVGDAFKVFQNSWWSVLLADAGAHIVNLSSLAPPKDESRFNAGDADVNIAANSGDNIFAKQSWAIIDTTQYDQVQSDDFVSQGSIEDFKRVDASSYVQVSGASANIYAVKEKNVFLTDKSENRNLRHNFYDAGRARPDLALRDIVSIVSPKLMPGYTTYFVRRMTKPEDQLYQLADGNCAKAGDPAAALNLTQCTLPNWAQGYHASGLTPDAYDRPKNVESMAVKGVGSHLSVGQKAGIAVGAVVGGLLLIGAAGFLIVRRRRAANAKKSVQPEMVAKTHSSSVISSKASV